VEDSGMAVELSQAIREFLDGDGHFAVVGSVNADGSPHQAVVWYRRYGDGILVNARTERKWAANARRTGQLSAAIASAYDYVIIRGQVEVVDDPTVSGADIRALARRYGEDESQFEGQRRVSFLLHADRVSVHGRLAVAAP
jgi:PPOX class probable F420-dependent enzyme